MRVWGREVGAGFTRLAPPPPPDRAGALCQSCYLTSLSSTSTATAPTTRKKRALTLPLISSTAPSSARSLSSTRWPKGQPGFTSAGGRGRASRLMAETISSDPIAFLGGEGIADAPEDAQAALIEV